MFKKKFSLAFVIMFIATLILTTMTSEANEELYAQRRTNRKQTTRKSNTRKSQGYPSWVKWSWKYKIIKDNGQNKFKIDITYKNNSRDKIIKCFFNRNLTLSFKQCVHGYGSKEIKYKGKTYIIVTDCTSNAVSYPKSVNCKVYPGESYTLTYYLPFSRFNWKQKYDYKRHKLLNFKLSHKFQVQKENMDVE